MPVEIKAGDSLRFAKDYTLELPMGTLGSPAVLTILAGELLTVCEIRTPNPDGFIHCRLPTQGDFSLFFSVKSEPTDDGAIVAYPILSAELFVCVNAPHQQAVELELFASTKEKPMRTKPERYALYVVKKGERTPACMIMQMSFNKLMELGALSGEPLVVDSIYGLKTEAVVKDFQSQLGTKPDGLAGKNTWAAIIDKLPEDWRPPLQLRMMTWMDSYENGSRRKGFSAYNIIPKEGWYNFGVFNTNKGSAKTVLRMGGAGHLAGVIETQPMDVADWFGSSAGRKAQLDYTDKYIIPPSIHNLERVGLNLPISSEEALPNTFDDPWMERLFVLSCDITVNSGAGGFRPRKSPRQWDGGQYPWPTDRLPAKEDCKAIFSEEFGQKIPSDYEFVTSDSRDTYGNALKRCLEELCKTNEQKIELVGELQARCVISTWRDLIIQRRRSIARAEGHFFQGGKPSRLYFGVC